MRIVKAAAVAALLASPSFAGGIAEPVIEPEVVAQDAGSSSAGILVPLLLLVLIGIAISGGGSENLG